MRLSQLEPRWWAAPGRQGQGVIFKCPHCVAAGLSGKAMVWLCIAFSNPLDGGAPLVLSPAPRSLWAVLYPGEDFEGVLEKGQAVAPPGTHWRRAGNTFDELTLMPSVDYSAGGHWHGFVTKGTIS